MKKRIETFIKYLIISLMVVFPLLDMRFFFSRITTLVEILIILLCLILTFFTNKESRKNIYKLIIYYVLCMIYLFINYIRSKTFNSVYPNNFNYSLYRELLTIIKLMMPITFYFVLRFNNINKKAYKYVITYWSIFISSIIILSDIFKIGYSSYGDGLVQYNIFEWKKDIYYVYTSCKGFFNYANQEACILLMLLAYNVYNYIYKNKKNLLIIFMLVISMIILGTRTSMIGGLLLLTFLMLFSIFYNILNKQKTNKRILFLLIPIIIWILFIPISPYYNRNGELYRRNNIESEITESINEKNKEEQIIQDKNKKSKENNIIKEETKEDKLRRYVDENVNNNLLPEVFYKEYYSYYNDPKFWVKFLKDNNIDGINYRKTEIAIIKRVKKINNKKSDTLFGIGNSRIQDIVNIERDFILQYYSYGIIGCLIILSPYIYLIITLLISIKKTKKMYDIYILGIVLLFLLSCFLTGNILNFLTCSIPMIFIYSSKERTK